MRNGSVFIAGGTGYIGRRLIPILASRGHSVRALVRKGSEQKLPPDCSPVLGDALDHNSFEHLIQPAETYVQLVGVSHPSPSKTEQFRSVDLISARASVTAAVRAKVRHFIYLSVAHPAPVMKAYIEVRREAEEFLKTSGLNSTILRPWYVLGPGHRWPYLLLPLYGVLGLVPSMRESARRLGLVTLDQMLAALTNAAENPATGVRIVEVPEIRTAARENR